MCGIAGIAFKQETGRVGDALIKMLGGCQHRGPDSTGLAMYGPPEILPPEVLGLPGERLPGERLPGEKLPGARLPGVILRLFLNTDLGHDANVWTQRFGQVQQILQQHHFEITSATQDGAHARISGAFAGDIQQLSYAVEATAGVEIFSAGHNLEIVKDEGTAADIEARFGCASFEGYYGIGHVRLATESDVNPSTAHPFWAYGFLDVSIVHNGQITNYFKLRRWLEQRGYRFRTENDSEVIAVYLADKMKRGVSMEEALDQSLTELDGTFSFLVSTPQGIGYAKDSIGAKPMVIYETDELVAIASEEVSLQQLFGHGKIDTYEPVPGTSCTWSKSTPTSLASAR